MVAPQIHPLNLLLPKPLLHLAVINLMRSSLILTGNIVFFIFTIIMNALANALPLNGKTTGELSNQYPNFFVPAGITFSIWSIIYLFLLLFIIYPFTGKQARQHTLKIGPWFMLSCICNGSWILAWHYELVEVSVLIMLAFLYILTRIYRLLENPQPAFSTKDKWMLKTTFSVYLGWISIATIANITTLLVHHGWGGGPLSQPAWACIAIGLGTALGAYIALSRKDTAFILTLLWAFTGIFLKQYNSLSGNVVALSASLASAFLIIILTWSFLKSARPSPATRTREIS